MSIERRWTLRALPRVLAVGLIMSVFGVWFQHPKGAAASWNCPSQCYGKVHWTTTNRGSFAGSFTFAKTPTRTVGYPTKQYYGSWVWDDVGGSFITVGIIAQIDSVREGTFPYFGWQPVGDYYHELVDPLADNFGEDNGLQLHREWSDPYNKFYASYSEHGTNPTSNALTFSMQLEPTRASIGLDARGSGLSLLGSGWSNNLYILNDGSYNPHRGMQDGETFTAPIAGYWRPAPTDYNSIGGNLVDEAP